MPRRNTYSARQMLAVVLFEIAGSLAIGGFVAGLSTIPEEDGDKSEPFSWILMFGTAGVIFGIMLLVAIGAWLNESAK